MFSIKREQFIEKITKKIKEKKAFVFFGSGINKEAGLPDWRELMQDLVEELGIKNSDLDQIDYIDLAQFVIHLNNGRNTLIDKVLKKIDVNGRQPGKNLLEICKVPINEFWTTNYDGLIEKAMEKLNKNYNKIVLKSNFVFIDPNLTNIYKMHGDFQNHTSMIISRNDYDLYTKNNLFFWNKLALELSYKNCVFIGTSFNDYNLNVILSKISTLVENDEKPNHYIFFEKNENEEIFRLQELKSNDLFKRFNIKTVWLEGWNDIEIIFKEINNKLIENNIFISGAAAEFDDEFKKKEAKDFISKLSYKLVEAKFKIFTGYGLEVGDSVVTGAMSKILECNYNMNTDKLEIFPFPQFIESETEKSNIWEKNRRHMITNSSIVIFMFGNKKDENSGNIILSNGMIDHEFRIAKELGKKIIPISATGYAALKIFEKIEEKIEDFPYLKEHINTLRKSRNVDDILDVIKKVAKFKQ